MKQKVLIAGASGVVGFAAAKHFAQQPGWQVVAVSRRPPRGLSGVELLSVDLADRERCHAVFSRLGDVTHVVYAALYEKPGLVPGWFETDQMQRNLEMLANLLDPLAAAAELRHVSLLQGTKAYGCHLGGMAIPGRERAPRHAHENFYWLQEDYLRDKQQGRPWQWTILRPQIVFGEAFGSNMNPVPAFGVYAALLKHAGLPLHFPGGAPIVAEAVDADLLARALDWAASSPEHGNQIFNVTNGDVMTMRGLWPTLAEATGMRLGDDVPMSLAVEMPKRQAAWEQIVRRFELASPPRLEDFVGQSFIYADLICGHGVSQAPPPMLVSTVKIRQAGFHDCVDSEDMLRRWIDSFQRQRYLPPREW
jgi:nucleoside-diphosphate-sugar epimerase